MKTSIAFILLALMVSCGGSNSQSGRTAKTTQPIQPITQGINPLTNLPYPQNNINNNFNRPIIQQTVVTNTVQREKNPTSSSYYLHCENGSIQSVTVTSPNIDDLQRKLNEDGLVLAGDFDRATKTASIMGIPGVRSLNVFPVLRNEPNSVRSEFKKSCKRGSFFYIEGLIKHLVKGENTILVTKTYSGGTQKVEKLTYTKR